MRRAVAIYGATEEALQLVSLLEDNPSLEVAAIYDPDPAAARVRAELLDPATRERVVPRLTGDPQALLAPEVRAVIDAGAAEPFARRFPEAEARGLQVVSPLTARLLWGYGGVSSPDRKTELLQALHEVVESVNLTVDTDELFARMLEIAMSVTGADGGSLMLLDAEARSLSVRVAVGVEKELWPKIRVRLGEGIAGRAAADARPIRVRGKADQKSFRLVRERFDVESALCVPLVHGGRVLGVLNLSHATRTDAFSDDDLAFAEQLGRLDAEIIARAQEHELLRSQANRYGAVREVQQALAGGAPLLDRLGALCGLVARRVGGGIATLYLYHPDERELRLAATSLVGGGLGGDYRIPLGQGVDGGAAQRRAPAFLPAGDGGLAYAALPLLAGDELAGLLSVQVGAESPPATHGRALEETLLEIAAAAADAISRASREARISARATKVGAINEAGLRMISARDPAEVARLATSSGALILGADHAVLRLQDPETRRYVIRSYYGSADGRLEEKLFRLDKAVSIEVLRRRAPAVLRELPAHETHVRSAMAAPLRRDGTVIGTLALYDKIAPDQFFAEVFNDEDLGIFNRYVSYVERAVANALFYEQARQHRSFDEETGLPNADYLARRVDQELARVAGRDGALALASCRVENLDAIRRAAGPVADRVVRRVAEALRAHLRDFDVLGRSGDEEFLALLPEPGPAPEDRIASLARGVADDVAKDDRVNQPVRVALAFGYAIHPAEGADRKELEARARVPRIRMV